MEKEAESADNRSASKLDTARKSSLESKFVELNIGGKLFACSTATLLRFPNTRFASLFDSQVDDEMEVLRDPEDHIFIDRDPDMFMFVLEFLRNGRLSVASYSVDLLERIDAEARFFKIQPLEHELTEARKKLDPSLTEEKSIRVVSARPESIARSPSTVRVEQPAMPTRAVIGFIEYAERLAVLSTVGREPHTQVSLTGRMLLLEALLRLMCARRPQLKSLLDDLRDRTVNFDDVMHVLLSPPLLKRAAFDRLDCFRVWLADLLIPYASLPITVGDANSKRYLWPLHAEPHP